MMTTTTDFWGRPCRLLHAIEETGSLRAASASMNMAYTKALSMIKRAEKALNFPLTEKNIGGRGGGGSRLTPRQRSFYRIMKNTGTPAMRQTYESTAKSFPAGRKELFPVGCVIMASGLGRRFGGNKLLSDFHGKALISHAIEKAGAFPFAETVVVTRYEEIAGLCAMENIPFLLHRLPGKNDTLRLGLCRLLGDTENQMQAQADMEDQPVIQTPLSFADRIIRTGLSGCLFWPADQPLVTLESLNSLVRTFFSFPVPSAVLDMMILREALFFSDKSISRN